MFLFFFFKNALVDLDKKKKKKGVFDQYTRKKNLMIEALDLKKFFLSF